MFKYHKRNQKSGNKSHLQKSLLNYSPFDLRDTRYLEHLHKELKLRNAREAMISLRNDMIESNKRANYQNEKERLENQMRRDNLPYPTKEHMADRQEKMTNPFKKLYGKMVQN